VVISQLKWQGGGAAVPDQCNGPDVPQLNHAFACDIAVVGLDDACKMHLYLNYC
jgi:hypothetical protein